MRCTADVRASTWGLLDGSPIRLADERQTGHFGGKLTRLMVDENVLPFLNARIDKGDGDGPPERYRSNGPKRQSNLTEFARHRPECLHARGSPVARCYQADGLSCQRRLRRSARGLLAHERPGLEIHRPAGTHLEWVHAAIHCVMGVRDGPFAGPDKVGSAD